MSKYEKYFIGVIILAILAGIINFTKPIVKGLDIAGGIRVVMQVDPSKSDKWPYTNREERVKKMNAIKSTMQTRVSGFSGVSEPRVALQNVGDPKPRLVIELPGVKDPEKAIEQIKSTASLKFYYLKDINNNNNPMGKWRIDSSDDEYIFTNTITGEVINSSKEPNKVMKEVVTGDPILTGKDLLPTAKQGINPQNKGAVISIEFNNEGREIFAKFTRSHVGDILAVFLDNKLLTAPTINEPIPGGKAEISGFKNLDDAKRTAQFLNAGALPVPLKIIGKNTVEPTLGIETVNKVIFAGIIGLLAVVLFMMLYYRLPGIIANIALILYALFVLAVFRLMNVTMSLAGIAALVISIGMAVDANILIFERLKEELSSGKTLNSAIDAGFTRAFTAIFDSNMCTAITCAILIWYGTPSVQSFAITLFVGVVISMFTAITVTRTILHMLVKLEWAQNEKLFGLATNWFAKTKLDIVGKRAYYFLLSAVLLSPGLYFLATSGLKPGIEFLPGTAIQATFNQPVELMSVRQTVEAFLDENVKDTKVKREPEIQLAKTKDGEEKIAFIRTLPLNDKLENGLRIALNEKYGLATISKAGVPSFDSVDRVEPTISKELTRNSFFSVMIASIGIVLYLAIRFAIGGIAAGLKYGVCAVIALIHDAAFILGFFAILGKFAGWEVDSLFVTAILTVIGFSVHDTIVVFDRVRENMRNRLRGETFEQLANRSILQTFSRSINTSLTVVLTLTALIIFGGPLLRHFYVAMLVGIVIGTYSSIFNATQLVVVWDKIAERTKEGPKKVFEDKPLVSRADRSMVTPAAVEEKVLEDQADNDGADASARIKKKTTKKKRR